MGMMQVRASSAATACTCTAENGARSGISGLGWARVGVCGLGRGRLLAAFWVGVALLLGGGAAPAMARVAASGVASAGSGSPARLVGLDRRVTSAVQRHVSLSFRGMRPAVTVGRPHAVRLASVRSRGVRPAPGRRSSLLISPAVTSALGPAGVGAGGHAAVRQLAGAAIDPACIVQGGYEACQYKATGQQALLTVPDLALPTAFVELIGGSGGDAATVKGGFGGYLSGYITVAGGDQLEIETGGQGSDAGTDQVGGWPDGGGTSLGGGGGGSSSAGLKRTGEMNYTLFALAAGGGGAGGDGGSGYASHNIGSTPLGGAGGAAASPGEPGQGGTFSYDCLSVAGGSAGAGASAMAGGAGGPQGAGCDSPGTIANGADGTLFKTATTTAAGDGGHGGFGFPDDGNGGGGGGGGGFYGGGGGGAGGAESFYFAYDPTNPYNLGGGGGGGGGGLQGDDPNILSVKDSALFGTPGDGLVNMLFVVGDITPPVTTIDSAPVDPTDQTDATITFHGTDAGTGSAPSSGISYFQCRLDGGAWATCSSPKTYPGLSTGTHTVSVRAVDNNGNMELNPATTSWTFMDNNTAPVASIDVPPPNPSYLTSASIAFSATDNSGPGEDGIDHFECQLDGGGFTRCASPATYSGLSVGAHSFEVYAVDRGLNVSNTVQANWTVSDATDPSTCTTSGTRTTCTYTPTSGLPSRTWTVPDDITHATISADGAAGGESNGGDGGVPGGQGGSAVATIAVTPGEVLRIFVGGYPGSPAHVDCDSIGGANGGGNGTCYGTNAGGGGGASDVRRAPYGLDDRLVVGGGGGGASESNTGGNGGGAIGADGAGANGGGGASQTQGGDAGAFPVDCQDGPPASTAGALGVGGNGALESGYSSTVPFNGGGGGGGGGYYGGGGGGADCFDTGGGGGGGSSFAESTAKNVALTPGGESGDGQVQIAFSPAVSQTIDVTKAAPSSAAYGTSFTVAATGGGSGNPVTYAGSGACSNSGPTFTMTSSTGTCTVTYNQAGDDNYDPAPQVQESVTAQKASQTINVTTHAPSSAAYGTSFTVAATGGGSPNPVTYAGSGACSNTGPKFTMTSSTGICTVTYDQAGDDNYDAAPQVQESVTAQKASQTISVTTHAPASAAYGTSFTVAATDGGGSPNPVTYRRVSAAPARTRVRRSR